MKDPRINKPLTNYFIPDTYICVIFLKNAETKQKHDEIHKKNSWFKDTFLDSKRKLKEEIHEELKRYVFLLISTHLSHGVELSVKQNDCNRPYA
jgi:hypothetical protein